MSKSVGYKKKNAIYAIAAVFALAISLHAISAKADSSDDLEPLAPDSQSVAVSPTVQADAPPSTSPVVSDQKIENDSDKTDELELNNEVEGLEQYGDAAEAQTATRETKRLARENKQLAKESIVLKHRREHAQAKAKRLEAIYQKTAIAAVAIRKKADRANWAAERAQQVVDRVQARINAKRAVIQGAKNREVSALRRIAFLKLQNRRLQAKLAREERILRWRERRIQIMKKRAVRLSQYNRRLNRNSRRLSKKVAAISRSARIRTF